MAIAIFNGNSIFHKNTILSGKDDKIVFKSFLKLVKIPFLIAVLLHQIKSVLGA